MLNERGANEDLFAHDGIDDRNLVVKLERVLDVRRIR